MEEWSKHRKAMMEHLPQPGGRTATELWQLDVPEKCDVHGTSVKAAMPCDSKSCGLRAAAAGADIANIRMNPKNPEMEASWQPRCYRERRE